jgi:predicted transcriptional regulator
MLSNLPPKQKLLLQAIAKEKAVKGITSAAFIKKYNQVSASSVQSALKPLLKNDVVTMDDGVYRIYDYFFSEWLANTY